MRTSSNPLGRSRFRGFGARELAPGESEPPAPLRIFARLGVLLAIALAFGMAAHVLVGVPH